MTLKEKCQKYLVRALNEPSASFRDGQWEAIRDIVVDKKTLLLVRRTGWGKSMVYFLATRLLRDRGAGPTLLISPLLALMRNQIEAASRIGITAETINSSNNEEWARIEQELARGAIDVLLISPERLANAAFRANILNKIADKIGLFVVDEAHCISDWGHDFRPDYQRITRILQAMPDNVPVLGTTATANDRVVEDVIEQLGSGVELSRGPLARASLRLQNIEMKSPAERMAWLAENIPKLPGSGIIYTLTVRDTRRVTDWLRMHNIDAHAYFGRLDKQKRDDLEQALLNNDVKVLVSTVALGMGFDKPDIGFVVHYQRPGSVVHYYQQVGRAGRDDKPAYGILFHGSEDDDIIDYFIRKSFPIEAHTESVLAVLENADQGLKVYEIENRINLHRRDIQQVLKLLSIQSRSPVVKEGSQWSRTPVPYIPEIAKIEAIKQIRRKEQQEMQEYMHHTGCLMSFLQKALDDPYAEPCGICASCNQKPLVSETVSHKMAVEAAQFLKRSEIPINPRKRWPYTDALSDYGWKGRMEDELKAETGRVLSVWGDAGWGKLVRQGKYRDEYFHDKLVEGSRAMIKNRWKPDPAPQWVTCVPSNNQPKLVPNFSKRLARSLNLPFLPCIKKVKDNHPQKDMENTEQQTQNLNGVFDVITELVRNTPVLLVDDTVDSRWTMTVIAALLKEAGAGPVYPYALAQTTRTSK